MGEIEGVLYDKDKAGVSLTYHAYDGWMIKISNLNIERVHLEQEDVDIIEDLFLKLATHLTKCVIAEETDEAEKSMWRAWLKEQENDPSTIKLREALKKNRKGL